MQIHIKQIEENERNAPKYKYEITYPLGNDPKENKKILQFIKMRKNAFLKVAKERQIQKEFLYTLFITYRTFEFENFHSIVFEEETYLGGAHPDHTFKSFVFDLDKEQFITIQSLTKDHPEFLKKVCYEARKILLKKNPELLSVKEMFLEGTRPFLFNYEVFAYTKEGMFFLFSPYQIAPYSMGKFEVIIPYQALF